MVNEIKLIDFDQVLRGNYEIKFERSAIYRNRHSFETCFHTFKGFEVRFHALRGFEVCFQTFRGSFKGPKKHQAKICNIQFALITLNNFFSDHKF